MIQISKPHFSEDQRRDILDGISNILSSGRLMMGPYLAKLEQNFSTYTGTKHSIGVNSCTTALQICLQYFGVSGFEVLVPAASFTTDVSAPRWCGAKPVLVDIDPETLSFDVADLQRKLSPQCRGIVWVHLTGLISPQHQAIIDFAREHNLFLLEDCAHAQGAAVGGRKAGSLGTAGCFSFFPTKLMTCGTGGMITTNDPALDRFAREVRVFGRSQETGEVVREGNDWFLDEFRACIAGTQLADLDAMLARRRTIAERYYVVLANQPGISLLDSPTGANAYYQFPVFLDQRLSSVEIGKALGQKHGIQAKRIYLPVHEEKIFKEYNNLTLKVAENVLHRSLCLPIHPDLTDHEVEKIGTALIGEVRARL